MPQVYFDDAIPYYHSAKQILKYGFRKFVLKHPGKGIEVTPTSFTLEIDGCRFDVGTLFSKDIRSYLASVIKARSRVHLWWRYLPRNTRIKAIIFSVSPVFLDDYFLILKIRENGGKVITWQHGGFFGYADHPVYQITDYRSSDYFLTYGESHKGAELPSLPDRKCRRVPVGSHKLYPSKASCLKPRIAPGTHPTGLFLPAVIGSYFSQSRTDWDPVEQFRNLKLIIDHFASGRFGRVLVKGLRNHQPHRVIEAYVAANNTASLIYTEADVEKIIAAKPSYIVLDAPSTPLLEILTRFDGPVFVINCQRSWSLHPEALAMLKQRVFYSESVPDFESQFKRALSSAGPASLRTDPRFLTRYAAPFSIAKYTTFMNQVINSHVDH